MAARTPPSNRARAVGLSLAEQVCLALIVEERRHGWALVKELDPSGPLGSIWSLTRPLTYRAIEQLESRGLITRGDPQAGQGGSRVALVATAAGRRAAARWLREPVPDLADLGTEFLLKATLTRRSGGDALALLDAQEAALAPVLDELGRQRGESDLATVWRRESARAAQRFFRQVRADLSGRPDAGVVRPLRLSARNQLHGTVEELHDGEVLSTVRVGLPDGQRVTATITKEATRDLDLAAGDAVLVIVKSTEVMIAK